MNLRDAMVALTKTIPEILHPNKVAIRVLRDILNGIRISSTILRGLTSGIGITDPNVGCGRCTPETEMVLLGYGSRRCVSCMGGGTTRKITTLYYSRSVPLLGAPIFSLKGQGSCAERTRALFSRLHEVSRSSDIGIMCSELPGAGNIKVTICGQLVETTNFRIVSLRRGWGYQSCKARQYKGGRNFNVFYRGQGIHCGY